MTGLVPPPPDPFSALIETWPAGGPLYRVHSAQRRATEFNPGVGERTRFAFFGDPPVPVLYGGGSPETAVAETLLHDVGMANALLGHEVYRGRHLSEVVPRRDLQLVQLHSGGLVKLGVEPQELTATSAAHYLQTVRWAEAAHRGHPDADGLVWMSRRWNGQASVLLFGDRVEEADLESSSRPLHDFDLERSFAWLYDFCRRLGVDVQPPPSGAWAVTLLAMLGDVDG